ncbi:hypothetical protein H6761_04230 [Candidatus Nomurabacteria bacterium]|nr:hypothetical protein [Candidatus Nomurabacteria bacterium]
MFKDFEKEEELDFQSGENYPWEYEESHEIWVADLNVAEQKKSLRQAQDHEVVKESELEQLDLAQDESEELELAEETSESFDESELQDEEGLEVTDEDLEISETEEDLILETRENLEVKNKKSTGQNDFSWLFFGLLLLAILFGGEIVLLALKNSFYWTDKVLFLLVWLWRFVLLISWLFFSLVKKSFFKEKIVAATLSAFTLGVFFSAIWKIVVIKSVWTWLNLLIEPIWMFLLAALVIILFIKIFKK